MGLLRTLLTVGLVPLGALGAYRLARPVGSRYAQIAALLVYVTIPVPYNALAEGRWGVLALYAAAPPAARLPRPGQPSCPVRAGRGTSVAAPAAADDPAARAVGGPDHRCRGHGPPRRRRDRPGDGGCAHARLVPRVPHEGYDADPGRRPRWVGPRRRPAPAVERRLPPAGHDPVRVHRRGGARAAGPTSPSSCASSSDPLGGAAAGVGLPRRGRAAAAHRPGRAPRVGGAGVDPGRRVVGGRLALAARRPPVHPAAAGRAPGAGRGRPGAGHGDGRGRVPGRPARATGSGGARSRRASRPRRSPSARCPSSAPPSTDGGRCRTATTAGPSRSSTPSRRTRTSACCGSATRPPCRSAAGSSTDGAGLRHHRRAARLAWRTSSSAPTTAAPGSWPMPSTSPATGQTARLGRLLAPMGVRYVVVAERLAPAPFATEARPAPPGFTATLDAQLDLEPLDVPAGLRVYRNQAFLPERAAAPLASAPPTEGGIAAAAELDLSGPCRPSSRTRAGTCGGRARWPTTATCSSRPRTRSDWQLVVDGRAAERQKPFGWAMGFPVERGRCGHAAVPHAAPSLRLPPRAGPGLAPRTARSHPHPARRRPPAATTDPWRSTGERGPPHVGPFQRAHRPGRRDRCRPGRRRGRRRRPGRPRRRRGGGRGHARCPTRSHAVVHLVLRRRHRHRGRLRRPRPAHRPTRATRSAPSRSPRCRARSPSPRPSPTPVRPPRPPPHPRPPPSARAIPEPAIVAAPAKSRITFFLRDIVEAPLAGAVVEVEGGEVAVEHEIRGDLGRATAPCATTASPTWSLPWGVTTRGARELLVFMNPFPDDATVDITFATDEGVRNTSRFRGSSCPGAASSAPTSTRTSPGRSRCRRRSRCAAAGWCSTASRPSPASTAVRASRSASGRRRPR